LYGSGSLDPNSFDFGIAVKVGSVFGGPVDLGALPISNSEHIKNA